MVLLGQFNTASTWEVSSARGGHEREIVEYIEYTASQRSNYIKTLGKRGKSGALETNKQGLIFQRFKLCNTCFHRIQNFHFADYKKTMHITSYIHVYIFEILSSVTLFYGV